MKKLAIFFTIIIIILCGISYLYLNYKTQYNTAKKANMEFENYLNVEVYGTDLATINNTNSINIEIKMLDNDTIYPMEKLYDGGIEKFINYYSGIKFKCVDIKYHKSTNRVKYMLFEQITQ